LNITVLAGIEKPEKATGKIKNDHTFGGDEFVGFNQIEIAPKKWFFRP